MELKDAAGKVVKGDLRADGKTWVPRTTLAYGTTYTATVTATGSDGKEATATSTFTTMAKPANTVRVSSNIGDGNVVGVGMPLVLRFGRDIPANVRDEVERRLWVTTSPAQEGSWNWFSGTELHYRPKAYWQAGTKLDFRIGTGGLPLGGSWYGRADLTIDASIRTDPLVMTVDNKTKKMTVTYKGQVAKTLPVSLGAARTPSSSGTMVVMERLRNTVFDTSDAPDPRDRYVTPIEYAQRLTWGGEFIHAAPWSVQHQGVRNVSHGCVNVSMANAAWLFNLSKVGDPITIKGTERTLQKGNGWTDWSIPWDQYIKGAALPREEAVANTPPGSAPSNG
jgi:lipoprotein-anchoring transpeptidase ErfK/SrfK